jgi:1-acyl-sn-glycerol-3-phosphate acyltransferase
MRRILFPLLDALFRVLFSWEIAGGEHIPESGPAIVAANHPSYLDPALLSVAAPRPVRFMAWDALFRVPILGSLIRAFGAFPVDVRPGQGKAAFAEAKRLLEAGEVVGLFPEGKRSRAGWMEERLREGAAFLALETGAPLVPATIVGAFRVWPYNQRLPKPGRIRIRFHEPIDPVPLRGRPEDEAIASLLGELRRRVDRTLLPGVKADLKMNVLYNQPSAWPRLSESLPALAAALLVFWRSRSLVAVAPAYGYIAYLLLDHFLIPQGRLVKWIRNASPILFVFGYAPILLDALDLPDVPAGAALGAIVCGALFPYLYEKGRTGLAFINGFVLAAVLEVGALFLSPIDAGPHIALPLFAAAFAWQKRSVYSEYAAPVLVAYAVLAARALGAEFVYAVPHAVAALLAWAISSAVQGRATPPPEDAVPPYVGLGLE